MTLRLDRIMVAVDGSEGARHALTEAIELARLTGGTLIALAVEGPLPAYAATRAEVDDAKREKDRYFGKLAAHAQDRAEAAGVALVVDIRPGRAADVITRCAPPHDADVVVVHHKSHLFGDHLLASTADRVAHHAHCPVMVVR
jgi:nucleotide-binding universal stress UspA family protein